MIIPIYNKADNVEAATNEQATPTLTLNITNATASLDLIVSDDDGTFATSPSDNKATFTVATNNFTGYTLSIKSSSSSTDLSGSSGSFTSIASSMDSTTFDKSDYNGKWGYLPSKYNSSANTTTYYPSPNTTGNTIDSTSSANSTANSYTIGIGARADYSKPVGTYTNTYVLTTVINSFSYSISYNKGNTADTVTNLPSTQTASGTSDTSVTLSSAEPTRDGYAFAGWCSVMPTTSDGVDGCSVDTYNPGDTFYFNKAEDNTSIVLYAMWEEEAKIYIQDLTLSQCKVNVGKNGNSANIGDTIKVYDRRDGNSYTVRYINGYCWMTQNLRIAGTIDNTNGWSNFTASSFDVSQYSLTDSTNCTHSGASSSAPKGYSNVCSYDSGDTDYGVYYNYAAVTAGTITGYSNSAIPTEDICPSGWHLPSGPSTVSGTDFNKLVGNTTSGWQAPTASLSAFSGVASGNYHSGSQYNKDEYGFYWSRAAVSSTNRYYLDYRNDGYYQGNDGGGRYSGRSVRCVRTSDGYMQDITKAQIDAVNNGIEFALTDKRDGNVYTVSKANGQLWMMQNLRFTGTALNTSTSNIDTDKTLTYYDLQTEGGARKCYNSTGGDYGLRNACIKDSGNATYGVWYNFAAATAMYVSSDSDISDPGYDICPKNWRLPTGPFNASGSDGYNIFQNTSASWVAVDDASTPLRKYFKVAGGYYNNGELNSASGISGTGYWWSATANNATARYYLGYNTTYGFYGKSYIGRGVGAYVRCVADPPIYMQDVTVEMAENMAEFAAITLTDKRDDKTYVAKKINGYLWMTQNLRFTERNVSPDTTNIDVSKTLTYYDLSSSSNKSSSGPCYGDSDGGNGYTRLCIKDSGDAVTGVWYNFAAASAGTITGATDYSHDKYDICPKNWHLPSGAVHTAGTNFNRIFQQTQQGWTTNDYLEAFDAVVGGYYDNGELKQTNYGHFWGSNPPTISRYYLAYNGSQFNSYVAGRWNGHFVRCIFTI